MRLGKTQGKSYRMCMQCVGWMWDKTGITRLQKGVRKSLKTAGDLISINVSML